MTWQRESQPAWSDKEWQSWRSGEWREWSCRCCSTSNWSGRKKCLSCRVNKSYLQASENPQRQPSQPTTAWTRTLNSGGQIDATGLAISKQLQNNASLLQRTQDGGPATQHPACVDTVKPPEAVSVHKQINKVEAVLASMDPEDPAFTIARPNLAQQLSQLKKEAIAPKPIGKRLDNCRSALDRAVRRPHDAEHTCKSWLRRRRQRLPHRKSNTRWNCEPSRRSQHAQMQRSTLQSPHSTKRRWRFKNF